MIALFLVLAIVNAVICFLIAYPLAYFIAFKEEILKISSCFCLLIPFWTNFLLHVYAWFYVLERQGFLNNLLLQLDLISRTSDSPKFPFCHHHHDGLLLSSLHGAADLLLL